MSRFTVHSLCSEDFGALRQLETGALRQLETDVSCRPGDERIGSSIDRLQLAELRASYDRRGLVPGPAVAA